MFNVRPQKAASGIQANGKQRRPEPLTDRTFQNQSNHFARLKPGGGGGGGATSNLREPPPQRTKGIANFIVSAAAGRHLLQTNLAIGQARKTARG